MESWRKVWREGFAPQFSPESLSRLLDALQCDDGRILQGATTSPPPMLCVQDWPCEAADAIGFIGWQFYELNTVGEVEEFFTRACHGTDQRIGEPAACRYFLNWFDDTPRDTMRRELIDEIKIILEKSENGVDTPFVRS